MFKTLFNVLTRLTRNKSAHNDLLRLGTIRIKCLLNGSINPIIGYNEQTKWATPIVIVVMSWSQDKRIIS